MIYTKDLSLAFNQAVVLNKINIELSADKINIIIGPSGAGKTCLLKCLVGLLSPNEGKIYFDDLCLNKLDFYALKNLRKKLGMLFQNSALFDSLSVEDNLLFPMNINTQWGKKKKGKRVDECLEKVGLEKVHQIKPNELSGGMRKRVGLARAIALYPKYLFVDEPNSGLDPQNSQMIDLLIREITKSEKTTTVIITHDMDTVMAIGESINFIHQGNIKWKGSHDNIMKSENPTLKKFLQVRRTFRKAVIR